METELRRHSDLLQGLIRDFSLLRVSMWHLEDERGQVRMALDRAEAAEVELGSLRRQFEALQAELKLRPPEAAAAAEAQAAQPKPPPSKDFSLPPAKPLAPKEAKAVPPSSPGLTSEAKGAKDRAKAPMAKKAPAPAAAAEQAAAAAPPPAAQAAAADGEALPASQPPAAPEAVVMAPTQPAPMAAAAVEAAVAMPCSPLEDPSQRRPVATPERVSPGMVLDVEGSEVVVRDPGGGLLSDGTWTWDAEVVVPEPRAATAPGAGSERRFRPLPPVAFTLIVPPMRRGG